MKTSKGLKRTPIKRRLKRDPLDALFSYYIRAKANGKCEYCGQKASSKGTHCHHFIGRRYRQTRWEEDNGVCVCFACHNLMHDFHTISKEFFEKRVGSQRAEELEIRARSYGKVDKDKIKTILEERIKALEV